MHVATLVQFVLLMPALVAGLTVALAGWAGRRAGLAGAGPASVAGMGLGLAVLATQLVNVPPPFPLPAFALIDVVDRTPLIILAATLLGVCEALAPSPAWTRWENRLLLGILLLFLVLGPVQSPEGPSRRDLVEQGGLLLLFLASWASLEFLAARRSTAVIGPTLLVVGVSIAAGDLLSSIMVLGQIGAGLAAALGVVWLLSFWLPDRSLSRGGVPVLVATYAALLLEGHVYSGLPMRPAFLLAAAPLAALLALVGPARKLGPWQSAVMAVGATLVPVGIALAKIIATSPEFE